MFINIKEAPFPKTENLPFEIVERKGIGHPDTLCDAIAERASQYYSQYFLRQYGKLAHHWFDKVLLMGGQSNLDYGQGELVQPYKVLFAGKAVIQVGNTQVPIDDLLKRAASDVLSETLDGFLPERNLSVRVELSNYVGPGQKKSRYNPDTEMELFDLQSSSCVSNDCNVCSGYAPLSTLERSVLSTEKHLSSKGYRARHLDTGFDIKIVGIRQEREIELFVNIPFIAAKIHSRSHYMERVAEVQTDVEAFLSSQIDGPYKVTLNPEKGSGRSYLTVTGSVADTGDVGVVGRGNRTNGLITPMRPMSIEAASGKNPIDHTGKLYGVLAQDIADNIKAKADVETQVHLVTFKEYPINSPATALVFVHEQLSEDKREKIEEIIKTNVDNVKGLTTRFVTEGVTMW